MIWFFTGLSFSHKQTTHPYTRMSDMYLEMSSCYGAEGVKSFCSHPYSWKCPIFPSSSVSENLSLCFKQSKCSHFSLEGAALLSLSFVCEFHSGQHSHYTFSMPAPTMIPAIHLLHCTTLAKQPPYAIESIVSSSVSFFARGHERILGTGGGSQSPRFCFIICVHLQPSYVTVSFSWCYRQSLSVPKNIFNCCT